MPQDEQMSAHADEDHDDGCRNGRSFWAGLHRQPDEEDHQRQMQRFGREDAETVLFSGQCAQRHAHVGITAEYMPQREDGKGACRACQQISVQDDEKEDHLDHHAQR